MKWRSTLCVLAAPLALLTLPHVDAAPLPPADVPTAVTAAIRQHVTAAGFLYGGDCQQVSTAQAGEACSLTTQQTDGSWSVQLYAVLTDGSHNPVSYDQMTVPANVAGG